MMHYSELCRRAIQVAQHMDTLYVMGCFGAPLTGRNVSRYMNNHPYNRNPKRQACIQRAANHTPPVWGFDCVNLIKAILWGWDANPKKTYGGAQYNSNGVPDVSANGMISMCKDACTTNWGHMDMGEVVWLDGHIGLYIGDNLVVESSPKWANGVQITALGNNGGHAGYHSRKWTKHGHLPYVDYRKVQPKPTPKPKPKPVAPVPDEGGENMTEKERFAEWMKFMARYRNELSKESKSSMPELYADAVDMGVTDGTRPRDIVTREEAAVMVRKAVELDKQRDVQLREDIPTIMRNLQFTED